MRVKAAHLTTKEKNIEWRSHEPSRIETFSDAVFAFAVTLIIVSLEVPKSYTELFEVMKGTFSFAACFATLFKIWNSQNIFFRRYGLTDPWTIALNGVLLFVVLIYAYPLKFLFSLLFNNNSYLLNGQVHEMITTEQNSGFMIIYGAGYTAINFLFYLLYANAKKQAKEIKLTEKEIYHTQTVKYLNLICTFIGVTAILLALLLPADNAGESGFFYFTIPLAYMAWFSYRGKRSRRIFGVSEPLLS